jgi:hypothetical protein
VGFLGDIGKIAGGFLVGGPAGALAAGVSVASRALVRRPAPQIAPTMPGLTGTTPFVGGASGGFAADSIVYRQGVFGNRSLGIYGPKIAANISNYPVGGGGANGGGYDGGGGNVQYNVASCPMPVGRGRVAIMPSPCSGYHWNRERYYVFGDCRTGSQAGPVEPGTRLVRNRRINPANAQAARRAARRLNGALHLLRSIERTAAKLVRRGKGGSNRIGGRSCGCKGKCKCG